ncbi:MAG: Sapep family Mn(2+)-dependent dipeptidase, partial [Eggerthellaceae bacterium]|nr:Sapep family Mn(2+)-dependent dipeptidase [Eggerthellaceae bacterium]
MDRQDVVEAADRYIDENWDAIVDDIASLVEIRSIEELDQAKEGEPFGPGPRVALDEALKISDKLGFKTTNVDGYVGFADLVGDTDIQLGIIGHLAVGPAGPGWIWEPFTVDLKDGYIMGRGVLDDKGPCMMALHAMKVVSDLGVDLPYTIRMIFGTNEETGMNDVPYYRARYADPVFLFTPDAEFPVSYGEKGGFDATVTSAPLGEDRVILEREGGEATNAVPGEARATVKNPNHDLKEAEGIHIRYEDDEVTAHIDAKGKSAHAATPEEGKSAIKVLVDYMIEHNLCNEEEASFLKFEKSLLDNYDGSGLGIKTEDEYFGPLTIIGGTIKLDDDKIVQTLDCRFPTSITPEDITRNITAYTDPIDATFENTLLMEPFLVKPDTPEIQALLSAYNTDTA